MSVILYARHVRECFDHDAVLASAEREEVTLGRFKRPKPFDRRFDFILAVYVQLMDHALTTFTPLLSPLF
jgi:hypothetical protein